MSAAADAGLKRAHFKDVRLPVLLLLPQLTILLLFFFIPSFRALTQSFLLSDPFGATVHFAGLDNFSQLLASESYRDSVQVTVVFTLAQNILTIAVALVLAFASDRVIRGKGLYKSIILLPYAIAPVIAGILWAFLFNPAVGPLAHLLQSAGFAWDPNRNGNDAMLLVVLAASWKHVCYDYIFLLAGLLSIPSSLLEAAAVDGAGPLRRFFTVGLPLLGPTLFFLAVMNFVYGFFEVFAIIHAVTRGGPAAATNVLVYKVFTDGFVNLDLGSSAAQSVILMAFALLMTLLQFRYVEHKVNYDT
jgi:sn-glycerol 3-phosphate transport system permease protein